MSQWNNYDYVMKEVKFSSRLLQYASKELKNNYTITMVENLAIFNAVTVAKQ
jgi:hypothetical protein